MSKHTIELGPLLFQFDSFSGWVNHAQKAWKRAGVSSGDTVCLDAAGRICLIGRDFMKARDEGMFPVVVFLVRDDIPRYESISRATGAQP